MSSYYYWSRRCRCVSITMARAYERMRISSSLCRGNVSKRDFRLISSATLLPRVMIGARHIRF